jgi:carbon monoxide dehydrogenase subunit G
MKIEGSFALHAPVGAVWDYLLDIEEVSECIPGVTALETIDAETYRGTLQVKIGPIKAAFGGTVTVLELEPPHRIVAAIDADDRLNASQVKATFTSTLDPIADGTEVTYTIDANVRGRLAQFGQAIAQSTAKKMASAFGSCIQKKLDAGEAT